MNLFKQILYWISKFRRFVVVISSVIITDLCRVDLKELIKSDDMYQYFVLIDSTHVNVMKCVTNQRKILLYMDAIADLLKNSR